jgi:hypothetical protein
MILMGIFSQWSFTYGLVVSAVIMVNTDREIFAHRARLRRIRLPENAQPQHIGVMQSQMTYPPMPFATGYSVRELVFCIKIEKRYVDD